MTMLLTRGVLTPSPRARYIRDICDIFGGRANVRAFYLPSPNEGAVVADAVVPGRLWTHGNTPAGRITRKGNGAVLSFNGTSDYITAPDAADLSFGNGAADSAFSIFAVANVTDTAAARDIFTKEDFGGTQEEYTFAVSATDLLSFTLVDQSAAVRPRRDSDAAITQGSWATFGGSYDGGGGATAANGMALYQNGAVIASTATNNAAYVAMENLTAPAEIGSQNAHTASFFAGSMGPLLLLAIAATLGQFAAAHRRTAAFLQVAM